MKTIKVSAGSSENTELLLRQIPGMTSAWGDCNFIINSDVNECDWWFVLHGSGLIKTEECFCDPNHIVYVSMEPNETMSKVDKKFLDQFSYLVTCDRKILHPRITYMNWLTWWVGVNVVRSKSGLISKNYNINYDEFVDMKAPNKINKISIIYSTKIFSRGHINRINFINKLIKSDLNKYIDVFGEGFNPIPDKWGAISNYKYHLVIENEIQDDYWSEKLADAFLGFSLPIYSGCPNIDKYFDKNSISIIDISNFDKTKQTIKEIIESNLYDKRIREIKVARELVLNEYNIFNLMTNLANTSASKLDKIRLRTNYYFSDSIFKKVARFFLKKLNK
jgi:hypothetical protein